MRRELPVEFIEIVVSILPKDAGTALEARNPFDDGKNLEGMTPEQFVTFIESEVKSYH